MKSIKPTESNQMKKTLITLGIFNAVSATAFAQSTVTLYGIVDAGVVYTTHQAGGSKTSIDSGQLLTSRWGLKGSEDLGGGLKANFMLESTLASDTGASGSSFGAPLAPTLFDRASTVGLSGNFGSISLGRQNMLGIDSVGLTDPLNLAYSANNPNVYYSGLNAGSAFFGNYGTNGGGTALRQNNSVKYLTPMVSGFGGAAMYGFGEQAAGSYAGLSGYFTNGSSGAAMSYAKLKHATDGSTLTLFGGGAKLKMDAVTFKLTYTQSEVDTTQRKIAVTGAGMDYAWSAATTLTGAFYTTRQSGPASGHAEQYIVMAKHNLSKRTSVYASLSYINAGSTAPADRAMAAGLISAGNSNATRTAVGVLHSF